MIGWQSHKISDLGRIVTGKTPPSTQPNMFASEVPFITPGDMSDHRRDIVTERFVSKAWDPRRRLLLPEGSICVVCIGMTIGKVCMTNTPSHTNQQINSIIVDTSRFDPNFIFYSMRILSPEVRVRSTGAQTRIINKTVFSEIEISVPPLDTQRRIGSILGAYDTLIEINRRRVAVLEDMVRGLYEEWFGRFRFPGYETRQLQGGFPSDWTVAELNKIAQAHRTQFEDQKHGELPLLDLARIPRRSSLVSEFGHPTELTTSRIIATRGDVMFTAIRPNLYKVVTTPTNLVTNVSVHVVRSKGDIPQSYIWASLFRDYTVEWASLHANGTKMPTLNWDTLGQLPVIIPDKAVLGLFAKTVQPMIDAISTASLANQNLSIARDLFLPRLISGQLSVDAAEQELEEAA